MKRILVRHDLVHRGGRTKDGSVVRVTESDVSALAAEIEAFAKEIQAELDDCDGPEGIVEF